MNKYELVVAIEVAHKAGHHVPLEQHAQYELVYYRYGHGITTIDEQQYTFTSGSFVVMPPNVWHDETHGTDAEVMFIRINTKEELPTGMFSDDNEEIYHLVKTIVDEAFVQKTSYKEMLYFKLGELVIMLRRMAEGEQLASPKSFEYVINFISDSYSSKIRFKTLAKQLGYSYDYFQHQFKKITGLSPQQYLVRRRINAAEMLLKNEKLSCTEIAYRCGFSNSAQFSSIFKRVNGISPMKFKRVTATAAEQERYGSGLDDYA